MGNMVEGARMKALQLSEEFGNAIATPFAPSASQRSIKKKRKTPVVQPKVRTRPHDQPGSSQAANASPAAMNPNPTPRKTLQFEKEKETETGKEETEAEMEKEQVRSCGEHGESDAATVVDASDKGKGATIKAKAAASPKEATSPQANSDSKPKPQPEGKGKGKGKRKAAAFASDSSSSDIEPRATRRSKQQASAAAAKVEAEDADAKATAEAAKVAAAAEEEENRMARQKRPRRAATFITEEEQLAEAMRLSRLSLSRETASASGANSAAPETSRRSGRRRIANQPPPLEKAAMSKPPCQSNYAPAHGIPTAATGSRANTVPSSKQASGITQGNRKSVGKKATDLPPSPASTALLPGQEEQEEQKEPEEQEEEGGALVASEMLAANADADVEMKSEMPALALLPNGEAEHVESQEEDGQDMEEDEEEPLAGSEPMFDFPSERQDTAALETQAEMIVSSNDDEKEEGDEDGAVSNDKGDDGGVGSASMEVSVAGHALSPARNPSIARIKAGSARRRPPPKAIDDDDDDSTEDDNAHQPNAPAAAPKGRRRKSRPLQPIKKKLSRSIESSSSSSASSAEEKEEEGLSESDKELTCIDNDEVQVVAEKSPQRSSSGVAAAAATVASSPSRSRNSIAERTAAVLSDSSDSSDGESLPVIAGLSSKVQVPKPGNAAEATTLADAAARSPASPAETLDPADTLDSQSRAADDGKKGNEDVEPNEDDDEATAALAVEADFLLRTSQSPRHVDHEGAAAVNGRHDENVVDGGAMDGASSANGRLPTTASPAFPSPSLLNQATSVAGAGTLRTAEEDDEPQSAFLLDDDNTLVSAVPEKVNEQDSPVFRPLAESKQHDDESQDLMESFSLRPAEDANSSPASAAPPPVDSIATLAANHAPKDVFKTPRSTATSAHSSAVGSGKIEKVVESPNEERMAERLATLQMQLGGETDTELVLEAEAQGLTDVRNSHHTDSLATMQSLDEEASSHSHSSHSSHSHSSHSHSHSHSSHDLETPTDEPAVLEAELARLGARLGIANTQQANDALRMAGEEPISPLADSSSTVADGSSANLASLREETEDGPAIEQLQQSEMVYAEETQQTEVEEMHGSSAALRAGEEAAAGPESPGSYAAATAIPAAPAQHHTAFAPSCKVLISGIDQRKEGAMWQRFRRVLSTVGGEWCNPDDLPVPFDEDWFNANVTHMIVLTDENHHVKKQTMKLLHGVAAGKWVLGTTWVRECIAANALVPEEPFEVVGFDGEAVDGPQKFRLREHGTLPLSGTVLHVEGEMDTETSSTRKDYESLARYAGANVVSEHPGVADVHDPESTTVVVLSDIGPENRRQSKYMAVEPAYLMDAVLDYNTPDPENYDIDAVEDEEEEEDEDEDAASGTTAFAAADATAANIDGGFDVSEDVMASSPPLF